MYFYVDESGQTGFNLFDAKQPKLYYGVLSSALDLDWVAEPILEKLRAFLGVDRIHASKLSNEPLVKIAPVLRFLASQAGITFDFYIVNKPDFAIIQFFDHIFDPEINPAMTYSGYRTPLRYDLLARVAHLFDDAMAKDAWEARITTDSKESEIKLIDVCSKVIKNLNRMPDPRTKELVTSVMNWVIENPLEIGYNIASKEDRLQISPNLIGFQFALHGIANRLETSKTKATSLVVDRQSQFNGAQEWIHDLYRRQDHVHSLGELGMPKVDFRTFPKIPIKCTPGNESAGLELVDVYLWIVKRITEKRYIAPELVQIFKDQSTKGSFDEMSLNIIAIRWKKYLDHDLPNLEKIFMENLEKGK